MKRVSVLIGIAVGISALIGGLWKFDCSYTRAARTAQLETRLERKILRDDARDVRQRMWDLQRHYGEEDAKSLPEYKHLKQEHEELMMELER